MNIPKIDLKELEEIKRKNFEDRLKFIEIYAEWLKKTQNEGRKGERINPYH